MKIINIRDLSKGYEVRKLDEKDIPEIFELCKKNPQYYHHCPPAVSIEGIKEDMTALPPGKAMEDKYYIGFFEREALVAVMDLIVGYPDEETAFIGFFMMNADLQGKGIGSHIIEDACNYLKEIFSKVRLGYVKDNKQSESFWMKNHFEKTGVESEQEKYTVVVMERKLRKKGEDNYEKIVAINASPRVEWNTGTLIREAAKGAESEGAEVKVFDLYKLDKFSGCISCFGCKLPAHKGICIYRDGLAPVLEEIRNADGLIIGTPNYLGDVTSGFRALYERLIFQSLTYKVEQTSYNERKIPVLFIMTSNASEEFYDQIGYDKMISGYQNTLGNMVGPTKVMICSDTLQVNDYDRYNWTMFNPEAKKARHEAVFPDEKQKAFALGAEMVNNPWSN